MNPARDDEDAQRTMERRALANVHSLARRLGYSDAIDRYGDKFVIISISAIVFLIVSAVGITLMFSRPDPRLEERRRCELDMAVQVMYELRGKLKAADPKLAQEDLERLVTIQNDNVKREAAWRCEGR